MAAGNTGTLILFMKCRLLDTFKHGDNAIV